MVERDYIRLTRTHARSGLAVIISWRSSLWLGRDHLLCIDTNGYTENYKRFYFRDIQAVSIRKTTRAFIWNIVLGALTAFSAVIALTATTPGMNIVFWIVAGLFSMLLALNLVGGTSCVCHLRTAVQTEELPSLNRTRRARKILKLIRPLIEAAQGPLAPEEIPDRLRELATSAETIHAVTRNTQTAPSVVQPLRDYKGGLHIVLCWLLLADAPFTVADFFPHPGWLDAINSLVVLLALGFNIACLIKQRDTNLPDILKRITWISLGCTIFFVLAAIGYTVFLIFTNPEALEMDVNPLQNPAQLALSVFPAVIWAVAGTLGLVHLQRYRKTTVTNSSPGDIPDTTA